MYPTIDELIKEISDESRGLLKNIAFAIIRPDAIERGFEEKILNDFSVAGLYVVGFKYQFVDERQMEEVYRFTQHHMLENQMRPLWWLTREMYKMSPAILLLLAGNYPDDYEDSSLYLESLKGSSNPALTEQRHIRYKYRSLNVILCTIHSSDDHLQSLRESRIFFSKEDFGEALRHVPDAVENRKPAPHLYLEKAVERWYAKSKRSGNFFQILVAIKIRILANLLGCGESFFPHTGLRMLYEEMFLISQENLPYVEEAEKLHPLLDKEIELLQSAGCVLEEHTVQMKTTDNPFNGDRFLLPGALLILADYRHYANVDFIAFMERLRRNLVVIDEWESLVLESSFVFHMIQLEGYHIK